MIDDNEVARWCSELGVESDQILHDHFVSHILNNISVLLDEGDAFVGGTALCRTHLLNARMSEDIDISHSDPRKGLAAARGLFPRLLEREFGNVVVEVVRDSRDHVSGFVASNYARCKIELVNWGPNRQCWPVASQRVALRYSDLPQYCVLPIPSAEAFVSMKAGAYSDRFQPRDLFDLAELAKRGAVNGKAEAIHRCTHGHGFIETDFRTVPKNFAKFWEQELARQTAHLWSAADTMKVVRDAIAGCSKDQ